MTVIGDAGNDTEAFLTVQIFGAGILRKALESLLTSHSDIKAVDDDGLVILLVGSEGQTQLRQSRLIGKRRRRERFVLLTNAQDIDYRLVREAPVEVFVGTDEPLPTLLQGIVAASRNEAFCSQQLVPALIAAAVSSSTSTSERKSLPGMSGEILRPSSDRSLRKPLASAKLESGDEDGEFVGDQAAEEPQEDDENLVSQEVRTLHLAIALGLSEREAEVAIEAVKGFSNTEIAELLTISVPTIKYHLYQAYQKLGIHRRSQLAAALFLPSTES